MKKLALGVAAVLMSGVVMAQTGADMPKIVNNELIVEGSPFVVKGMVFAPEPLGFPGNNLSGNTEYGWPYNKGAWICSQANQYSPGDWTKSACEDSDMFGELVLSTPANKNYNTALHLQWNDDFKNLKDMGVNTIRLYNINPTGRDHKPFLDEAYKNGIHVLYPALTDWMSKVGNFDNQKVIDGIKEVCGHKAILAFMVGNEFPLSDSARLKNITQAIADVRQYCPGALVSYAAEDDPNLWTMTNGSSKLVNYLPDLDFVTINAGYRGDVSTPNNTYKEFYNDAAKFTNHYKKPILNGEVGVYDNQDATFNREWFNYFWRYALERMKASGVIGAVYFEYNDEPIAKGSIANQLHMGLSVSSIPSDSNGREASKSDFVASKNTLKDSHFTGIGKDRYTFMNNPSPKTDIDYCNFQNDCKKTAKK